VKRQKYILFFYLPLLGFIVIFFAFSSLNRSYIKDKVEKLVDEQLQATAGILKVDFSHLLKENYAPEDIFAQFSGEENIYYMALLDENRRILGWQSQFEGYLPLSKESLGRERTWIIDSPAGKVFNSFSSFSLPDDKVYYLYLGYSLRGLEEMMIHSRNNFYLVFGIIVAVGILFSIGLYQLQVHYLEKKRELEEAKREKKRYRDISALTSGVAHEIKNPLNSLALLFELLSKKAPAETQEEISSGKEEIRRISRIIDQFSSSLKPLKLKKKVFSVDDVISDIQASLQKEAEEKGVRIQGVQSQGIQLFADVGLMRQALYNLVKNALEASSGGEVFIRAEKRKKHILVSVQDAGTGMTQVEKNRAFEPFFSEKKEGMGIGLYLVQQIVEAHGGEIHFVSEKGNGTTFTLEIPGG
jgi:signal transduction histidine kinase